MKQEIELDPALVVAEINQTEKIASVEEDFSPETTTFKLKATEPKALALEIKDLLGRSEYNAVRLHKVYVTPDRVAQQGEKWIDLEGKFRDYEPGTLVKGYSMVRCTLHLQP